MTGWVIGIIAGSLGVGLAFAIGVCLVVGGSALRKRVSDATWSPTSWATNFTAIGAVLGTVLASASLPAGSKPLDGKTLVALATFFLLLAAAGPFVFQCARTRLDPEIDSGQSLWGWNVTVLLACSLTLAAVIGQFATVALLYWEIVTGGFPGYIAVLVAAVFGCLSAWYYVATVPRFIKTQGFPVPPKPAAAPGPGISAPAPPQAKAVPWTLL